MAAPILPVNLTIPAIAAPAASDAGTAAGAAFQSAFADAVAKVESFSQMSHESIGKFLSGDGEELHQVAIKTEEAELSFDLFMQVRNKIVSAYQEVMSMQV